MTKERIAEYAYEQVPFYKDLADKKVMLWKNYPIVDKKMVQQNIDSARIYDGSSVGQAGTCYDIWIYWGLPGHTLEKRPEY